MLRREKPMSGAGTFATWPAARPRPSAHDDARLQAPWHDNTVRGARLSGRQADHAHRDTPYACRMAALSQANWSGDAKDPRIAPDRRQLRDPQTSEGEGVACQASTLQYSLHPDTVHLG